MIRRRWHRCQKVSGEHSVFVGDHVVPVHAATRTIRREKRWWTSVLLLCGAAAALSFVSVGPLDELAAGGGPALKAGAGKRCRPDGDCVW